MRFDLPLDRFQRELAARALAEAGAPFALDDADRFRDGARRAWQLYRDALARERPSPLVARAQHAIDRRLHRRDREEHLDDPRLPDARRARLQRSLDRLNRATFAYRWMFRAIAGLLEGARGELTVLDLGSGHGAFPIRLAARAADLVPGARLRVIGSDLRPDYVAIAREQAVRQNAAVEFRVLDALALDRLGERFDLIVCTQTVHHFAPEFVAELMARARANARRGVLFFDGRRSLVSVALAPSALMAAGAADPMFVHDGVVSIRRFYSPAELELLGRCAPGGSAWSATNFGPHYVIAEARAG